MSLVEEGRKHCARDEIMESIHFEKQEASLCAQHALNMLLQGPYFTAVDLAEIASEIDNREGRVLNDQDERSQNVDDSGYFSLQVIAEALKVFNLELFPLNSPRARTFHANPVAGQAYICNLSEHWFAVRRLGFQWFTLNSLLPAPRLISDTYLSLFFAQLINDGYSIFVVDGILPPCPADEHLSQCPVDPSLASMCDSFRDDQTNDPNIARAKILSSDEVDDDDDLRLALELSRQAMKNDAASKVIMNNSLVDTPIQGSSGEDDDELFERQLQKAIQMSMESCQKQNAGGPSGTMLNTGVNVRANDVNSAQVIQNEEIRRKREDFLKRFEK